MTSIGGLFPDGMKTVAAWATSLLHEGFAGKSEDVIAKRIESDGIVPSTVSDDGVKVYYRIISMVQNAPVRADNYADPSSLSQAGLSVVGQIIKGETNMEELVGQIEQDFLYGDDGATKPPGMGAGRPGAQPLNVSATGVVTPNPNAPKVAAPPSTNKSSPLKSAVDFLTKPAGPLPVWGWGAIGVTTVGAVTGLALALRKRY